MITFVILRILDVVTTLLNIREYGGWEVELNPTMRWVGERGLFVPYQIVMIVLIPLLVNRLKYRKYIYAFLSGLSILAVSINIYCLTL